jgi:outer membrane protein assembly factor BamB
MPSRWLSLTVLFCGTAVSSAGDWPQWLGPSRDGASTEKIAPWKESPKVLWKQPVGEGHSSPVVAGGKVFLHVKSPERDEEQLLAFDAPSGRELWRYSYPRGAGQFKFGNGPRATPTIAGGRVFAFGITGILTCVDASSGKQIWQVNTLQEFKASNLFFGVSCSPLVVDGSVVLNVGGPGASLVAFSTEKGAVVWKSLDDKATYSSPIVLGHGPDRQVIVLTARGLTGLAPKNGALFWQFPLVDKLAESSSTPVPVGDLLIGSSVTYGSACLKLETRDGKPAFTEVWKNPALTCYFATPVPVGKDHVYMVTAGLAPGSAALRCIGARTGKELWSKGKIGRYHASLLRTGDDRLLMLDDNGNLVLIHPDPNEYRELARSKVCGLTWAHPALANGKLYLRDDRELICLQLRGVE